MTTTLRAPAADRQIAAPPSPPGAGRIAPRHPGLTLALRLSTALAVVNAVAGVVSVLVPSVFRDQAAYAGNARGTFVVILFVALPALVLAMRSSERGSLRAGFVWLATVGYLLYNAVLASFSLRFNPLFLLYVASLSLGVSSLVAVLRCLDAGQLARRLSPRVPVRPIAVYLIVTAVAFALLWLRDVVPAMLAGSVPQSIRGTNLSTNVVEVIDLAFTLPLTAAAGVLLWRARTWGVLLAGTMLVFLLLESISVATDQYFGHLADPSQPTGAIALFVGLAFVGAVPVVVFLRGICEKTSVAKTVRAARAGSAQTPYFRHA
jgi:hypothetical protein